jgi:hypothetical protein
MLVFAATQQGTYSAVDTGGADNIGAKKFPCQQ